MSQPAALLSPARRALTLFAVVELVLVLAVPFLLASGYHELLGSTAGNLVEELNPDDPGWRAMVDPSTVAAVVEVEQGRTGGISLLVAGPEPGAGGAVVLVPGNLVVGGVGLDALPPDRAVAALAGALRLRIEPADPLDEAGWRDLLGDSTYPVDNPDPVVGDDGDVLLAVGPVVVGADNAAPFLGRPAQGADQLSLLARRRVLWEALLADPPGTAIPTSAAGRVDDGEEPGPAASAARALGLVAGPGARVVELPFSEGPTGPVLDGAGAETLIRDVVPVPAGPEPGDRVQVRVIDRTGAADLPAVGADLAAAGFEVVEIGNAAPFDGGDTELIVPTGLTELALTDLAELTGATTVQANDVDAGPVVTLLVGADFPIRSQ